MRNSCILIALLFLAPIVDGDDFGEEKQFQVTVVKVQDEQFNVYGHGLSGQVKIVLDGDEVFANGWRVQPPLNKTLPEVEKQEVDLLDEVDIPVLQLMEEFWVFYNKAIEDDHTKEVAREVALQELAKNPTFGRADPFKYSISIYDTQGNKGVVTFYPDNMPSPEFVLLRKAENTFRMLVNRLSSGDLVIIGTTEFSPFLQFFNGRPADVINDIRTAASIEHKITRENWSPSARLSHDVAESIRNPFPFSARERR